jgi:hypothetical protein
LFLICTFGGPIVVGVAISFAVIGKGFRLIWFFTFIPVLVINWGILYILASFFDPSDMWKYATAYISAWLLVPAARFFRHWKLRNV